MATVQKQGKGYKITVSQGYDGNGKRIHKYMTWVPSPGMSDRQIKKELERQAVLFEEKVQSGAATVNANIRFADFADKFMKGYAQLYLKPQTVHRYSTNLQRINQAIGHIKLSELRTGHINSLYQNLQETGVRKKVSATAKTDLKELIGTQHGALGAFSKRSGLCRDTIHQAVGGKPTRQATADVIAQTLGMKTTKLFKLEASEEPLSPATIISYHHTLSAILSKAVKWGYIQINPADVAEKPPLGRHEAAYLDENEARRLLELLQNEPILWRAIITFDLFSGLRRWELPGLRWQDVDLDAHTVTIRQTSNYLPEKGVYIGTPKTATSARPLLLSTAAIMMLLEYKTWQDGQRELLGDAWADKDGRVFTSDTGAPVFPNSVTQWFRKFIARSGLPKVTIHSLRHP